MNPEHRRLVRELEFRARRRGLGLEDLVDLMQAERIWTDGDLLDQVSVRKLIDAVKRLPREQD